MMREKYDCDGCGQRFTTSRQWEASDLPYHANTIHWIDQVLCGREDYCELCSDKVRARRRT